MAYGLNRVTVGLFAAGLLAPHFVGCALRGEPDLSAERRTAQPWPAPMRVGWTGFVERFPDWFADRFGGRAELLAARSRLHWQLLRVAPTHDMRRGQDSWLFYDASGSLADLEGHLPFGPGELQSWTADLEARADFCAQLGIPYLLAVAPSKGAVYPEQLPRHRTIGHSRAERVMQHLRRRGRVEVLDLRPALWRAKAKDSEEGPAYFPAGTHWTFRGARAGVRALFERLATLDLDLPQPWPRPEIHDLVPGEGPGDSWAGRLHLPAFDLPNCPIPRAMRASGAERVLFKGKYHNSRRFVREDGVGPTALVLHDSFQQYAEPFLVEAFSEVTFFWQPEFDPALVLAHKPECVIQLVVDRMFLERQPSVFELATPEVLAQRFNKARRLAGGKLPGSSSRQWTAGEEPFQLGELALQPGERPILRATFDIPRRTRAAFVLHPNHLHQNQPADPFEGYPYRTAVPRGQATVYAAARLEGFAGRLACFPGAEAGEYTLLDLEVRAEEIPPVLSK